MKLKDVCKMINADVYPKDSYFHEDAFVRTINLLKSYLAEESFNDLERIEGMLLHSILASNVEIAYWITAYAYAATVDKSTKINLLLKWHFTC